MNPTGATSGSPSTDTVAVRASFCDFKRPGGIVYVEKTVTKSA